MNRTENAPTSLSIFSAYRLLALFGLIWLAGTAAIAQQIDVLYNFDGGVDGGFPRAGLIRDSQGNLYGTTTGDQGVSTGYGSVFEITSAGVGKTLYRFTGGSDGCSPMAGLVRDSSGNLYGTAAGGGTGTCGSGYGVVFELSPTGTLTVLYTFTGGADGGTPQASLFRDRSGNLYGTTSQGGAANAGTVFEIPFGGAETVLYSFTGGSDGAHPTSGVVRDASGNLYGTAVNGGSSACTGGCGVVYTISSTGTESTLYGFLGGTEGMFPYGSLTYSVNGTLYGTTSVLSGSGTCEAGCGTVYSLTTTGTHNIIHAFNGSDGQAPDAALLQDSKGNLYGTTFDGGLYGFGAVFTVNSSGQERVLYNFTGAGDGANPHSTLLRDSKGNLYGTTESGGAHGYGTVFKIAP